MACTGRKTKIKGVAMKLGVVYGVDEVPTAAVNAIEAANPTIQPLQAEVVEHDVDTTQGGNNPSFLVGKHVVISFDVAFAGAGTAGDAHPAAVCLRACGYAQTLNPGTDARYNRVISNEEFADIYFWMDGALHKALGARGSFTVDVNKKQVPYMKFTFMALYAGPVTATNPTLVLGAFQTPVPVSNAVTSFSFHSITPAVESFTFNAGQEVIHDDKPGCEIVRIVDQKPGGSIALDAPALASFDPFSIAVSGALGTLSVVHGTAAGNIAQISGDFSEISSVDYADHASSLGYTHDYRYLNDPAGVAPDVMLIFK